MHLARILGMVLVAAGLTVLVGAWLAPAGPGAAGTGSAGALAGTGALAAALAVRALGRWAGRRPGRG